MKCTAHLIGFIWECRNPEVCENEDDDTSLIGAMGGNNRDGGHATGSSDSIDSDHGNPNDRDVEDVETNFVTYKDDSALKDQQSTGRKRAAKMFPLNDETLCEWAGKKNCGGGRFPITGCAGNLQQARHHGPDKNTLNNDHGNVHRICHQCHNRWHTLNDEGYVWNSLQNPHEPKRANIQDFVEAENFWKDRKIVKAKD